LLIGCATQPSQSVPDSAAPDIAAQLPIERSINTQALADGKSVRIDNPYGDVRLRFGGYEHVLEWRTVAQNGNAKDKIAITGTDANEFLVAARLPAGVALQSGQRVDITVYLPQGHHVAIVTEQGLIEARGLKGNLHGRSVSGNISFRGIAGLIDIETGSGDIEGQPEAAPGGSQQRIATTTGNIVLGLSEQMNAQLEMATSGVFATDFSVSIDPQPGQEPNKRAHAVIGKPDARIEVVSKRGEIRLLRRVEFRPA
jgi:hypothetical protein